MPAHTGFLGRNGLTIDPFITFFSRTAMNPALLLPLLLLAKFTKKGEELRILHPTTFSRLGTLFCLGLIPYISRKLSDGVTNNWADDKYDWPNEIAVVTGGADGAGRHIVRLLAERGVKVVVLDIQPMTFEADPNVTYFQCDVASAARVAEVAADIRARVGEPTILVNNAGVARGKTILGASETDLKLTFDVNVFGHFNTVREFLPSMARRNHGMVVTVSSFSAWMVIPNLVDYSMTKAAVAAFHDGLSAELKTRYNAPKVRTILVNQGFTNTPLLAGFKNDSPFLLPALEPESVADAICRQIFTGRSGHVVTPLFGRFFQLIPALPHWYTYRSRAQSQDIMANWKGRQVVEDSDEYYSKREKMSDIEGSTVLC
ncbi:NAD(P)-binding protein [Xylaria intraflava]|nr:NAD(P)-binding protein [Xylaria intraflava]